MAPPPAARSPTLRDELARRCADVVVSAAGLAVTAPLTAVLALATRATSPGPALFRQVRVGQGGREFVLYKLRTMTGRTADASGRFEPGDRSRVTRLGRVLRRTKVDELPQLWNVLRGDMSLVGPRPEVRRWVDAFPERWARILAVKPGITDPAALTYFDEEAQLAAAADPERAYREVVLPHKLELYERYLGSRSLAGDAVILARTLVRLLRPRR